MYRLCIGIVEDDLFYSTLLEHELNSMDYHVLDTCTNYEQAVTMLNSGLLPDLMLLDINLKGEKGGLEIANYIRKNINIPFIFLTGEENQDAVNIVKSVKPSAFLVKPFKRLDLHAAIEISMTNFNFSDKKIAQPVVEETKKSWPNVIFIKEGDYFYKVKFEDIELLASDNVYVLVHTKEKKFMVRTSLNEYLEKFDPSVFVRVHQRYAVNINKIEKINSEDILVSGQEIPISKSYKQALMKTLNLD